MSRSSNGLNGEREASMRSAHISARELKKLMMISRPFNHKISKARWTASSGPLKRQIPLRKPQSLPASAMTLSCTGMSGDQKDSARKTLIFSKGLRGNRKSHLLGMVILNLYVEKRAFDNAFNWFSYSFNTSFSL